MGTEGPRPDDIVVHRHVHSPVVYALSRFNAAPQFSYKTYDEAIRRAIRFARREHLDAWYTNDGQRYERIAKRRSSPRPKSHRFK
jgi:acyl-CoA reductase-like NAD-dependent aldehyde dehydrogenase